MSIKHQKIRFNVSSIHNFTIFRSYYKQTQFKMKFSLQETAAQAGLNKRTVRALEVRYSAVKSLRDRSGRLCYTKEDIIRLKIFAEALDLGLDIKAIAHCSNDELKLKIESFEIPELINVNRTIKEALRLISDYDSEGLEKLLYDCRLELSRERLILDFVLPLLQNSQLNSGEKSFLDFEIQLFLAQIFKSSYTKEYYPSILIIGDTQNSKNYALAYGVLLSSLQAKVSFAAITRSNKLIIDICRKTDCDAVILIGNFNSNISLEIKESCNIFIESIEFSAQGLLNTKCSVDQIDSRAKIISTIENIKKALKL